MVLTTEFVVVVVVVLVLVLAVVAVVLAVALLSVSSVVHLASVPTLGSSDSQAATPTMLLVPLETKIETGLLLLFPVVTVNPKSSPSLLFDPANLPPA